jgi:hypothetical protein
MAAHIHGTLKSFFADKVDALATLEVALCNYGAQVARITPGTDAPGLLADVTLKEFAPDTTTAEFSIDVTGNDLIEPAGTYYTFTIKDGNGDTIQVNAYAFVDGLGYDLNTLQPFDPSLPLMPLPPLLVNEMLTVADADTMSFDGTDFTTFKTTLHSDVLHATWTNMIPGNLYTFIILEDGTGGWQFNWGSTIHNGTMINHAPNGQTVQTFVADVDGQLYAISGGAYS